MMGCSGCNDTGGASYNCHYVNWFVRGFRPPAGWRISPPRFGPSRLRMHHIIHPQVVAPAIQSTPNATHCVVTMPHQPFNPSAKLLIPDYGPARAPFAHAISATLAHTYSQWRA